MKFSSYKTMAVTPKRGIGFDQIDQYTLTQFATPETKE